MLILVATDADEVFEEVDAALGSASTEVRRVREGRAVRRAAAELSPDLLVVDLQIGSMGGLAVCQDLRREEGAGRLDPQGILLLVDRTADRFLAERSGADVWLTKPLDAGSLGAAVDEVLAGA